MISSKRYVEYIHGCTCLVCGSVDVDAHHEPPKGIGGYGTSDFETVPLCRICHSARHGSVSSEHKSELERILKANGSREIQLRIKKHCEESKYYYLLNYVKKEETNASKRSKAH